MSFDSMKRILSAKTAVDPRMRDLQIARIFDVTHLVLDKLWGEERAAYVTPLSFREGTLKLETSSPAAKQQLKLDETRLKNEINRQLGSLVVRSMVIQSKGF